MLSDFWTPARTQALRHYWGEGLSQGAIARLLSTPGEPCTKSMVKSKAGREKLPDRPLAFGRADMPVMARAEPVLLRPDTDRGGCLWPHGDPRDKANFHFCGARQLPGKPYCSTHAAIAYVTPNDKDRSQAA